MKPGSIIKTFTTKKGRQAVIRVVKPSDLRQLLDYVNALASEDTFVTHTEQLTLKEERKYLAETLKKVKQNKKIHLIAEVEGNLAGSAEVRIGEKRKVQTGEIGISLSAPFREEGIGFVCMQSLIEEAKKLGIKILWLHCFENNPRARALYEKVGFTHSGTVPGMYAYKNSYIGEVTYYKKL